MKKNRSRSRSPIHFIAYLFLLVAVFLITEPAQSEVSCPSDITSYWMLDESSGTTFTDSIGMTPDASVLHVRGLPPAGSAARCCSMELMML